MENIELYLSTLKLEILSLRQLSPKTAQAYVSDVTLFLTFLYENLGKNVENCTKDDFYVYVESVKNIYSLRSIARKVAAIKFFFKTLALHFSINNTFFEHLIAPKIQKKLPQYLTQAEAKQLFESLYTTFFQSTNFVERRDACMIILLYASGMRISELIMLKTDAVKSNYLQVIGKGNKERIIPIPETCMFFLREYISTLRSEATYIFSRVNKKGLKKEVNLSRGYVYKKIKLIMRREFPERNFSPHSLRHSIATHLLSAGMDVRSLQAFLGHQKISTVALYTHLDIQRLKKGYQNFHPRHEKEKDVE
jgi:integrase/recombinase XerD